MNFTLIMQIFFGLLTPLLAIMFSLYGISSILSKLRDKLRLRIETNPDFNEIKCKIKDDKIRDGIESEILKYRKDALAQAILGESRFSSLSFLTKITSIIELIIFSALILVLLYSGESLLVGVKVFGAFLGGWIGIKTLVNQVAWSDPYVGKGYYYISLFGTLINIATGVLTSLFLYYLIF